MDLSTLFAVYAGVLLACGGSLTITWRQNPTEAGPGNWALASILASVALVIFAVAGLDKSQLWLNVFANFVAWAGLGFYVRGTRVFFGLPQFPVWLIAVYVVPAIVTVALTIATPYGPGIRIITGSIVFAVYSFDLVFTPIRRREMRSAPSYFISFFFLVFGITHTVRGTLTCIDPYQMAYARTVDVVLIFVGILGWGAIATGYSMLTTQRLLTDRARNLQKLQGSVEELRKQFEGLADGDYSVRAEVDGSGEPMDVLSQLFNDTVPKVEEAFAEVDRQRSVLSATQESMLDGLLLVDGETRVLRANPAAAQLLERPEEEIAEHSLVDLVADEDRDFARNLLQRVAEGPIRERPTRFMSHSGSPLTLTVNVSAHRDGNDDVQGAVLVVRDDRELKEAQAQLQMTDRLAAMGTVAAGVAHEINNPLSFVMSNVEFAIEELEEVDGPIPQDLKKELISALTAAHEGSERVRQIVRDLKNFSRSEEESAGLVDANELVESAAAMLRNEVRHHAVLELKLEKVPKVRGNEAKIGQVFLNLLHNAAQAIPLGHAQENQIKVSTVSKGSSVVVEVADSGEGIAPENIERIFDAFFTTKAVGVGTGLGLAICHRIVTNLGGRIEVDSEVGVGTTFRVILPAVEEEAHSDAAPTRPLSPRSSAPRRVLIIDDEAEIGETARRILGKQHKVDIALSAAEGMRYIQSASYDVILCDLMMPDMTGMQLFAELETQNPDAARRLVFMSGGVFGGAGDEFLRSVKQRCIAKPFDTETLRGVVARGTEATPAGGGEG